LRTKLEQLNIVQSMQEKPKPVPGLVEHSSFMVASIKKEK
jgi:hypothetical protein